MKYMADESDHSKKRIDTSKENTREQVAICMIVNDDKRSIFFKVDTQKRMSVSSSKASIVIKLSHFF